MKRYRIEVYVLGAPIRVLETDNHREAQKLYWIHNNRLDMWTQLFIDGKTGPKAWMDREIGGGQEYSYLHEIVDAEANMMKHTKVRKTE